MAYSATNLGLVLHNSSVESSLKNMIYYYSGQLQAVQNNLTYIPSIPQEMLDYALDLSKRKTNAQNKEQALKDFIVEFFENKPCTTQEEKEVKINKLKEFIKNCIYANQYLDENCSMQKEVLFRDLGMVNGIYRNYNIEIDEKRLMEIVETNDFRKQFELLYNAIVTTGHELTHHLQIQNQGGFLAYLNRTYIAFSGDELGDKAWELINSLTSDISISTAEQKELSRFIYMNYPHEIDARYGGEVFTHSLFSQLAQALEQDEPYPHSYKFLSQQLKHLTYEIHAENLLGHDGIVTHTVTELNENNDCSKRLAEIFSHLDIEKFAKIGIDLQLLKLSTQNEDFKDYGEFSEKLKYTNYIYNSIVRIAYLSNHDESGYHFNLLRQFVKDGNLSAGTIFQDLMVMQKMQPEEIIKKAELLNLLTSNEVNIGSFQSLNLGIDGIVLNDKNRTKLITELLAQNKYEYVSFLLPSQEELPDAEQIDKALETATMKYLSQLENRDEDLLLDNYYELIIQLRMRNLLHLSKQLESKADLYEEMQVYYPQSHQYANREKIYGKTATEYYYNVYSRNNELSQPEAMHLAKEVDELAQF